MKDCPFCGYSNKEQAETCERCKAAFPCEQETTNEEPIIIYKKRTRSE